MQLLNPYPDYYRPKADASGDCKMTDVDVKDDIEEPKAAATVPAEEGTEEVRTG